MKWFRSARLIIEVAETLLREAGEPKVLADLFDADFVRRNPGKIDFLAVEADSVACGDDDGFVVEGVIEPRQTDIATGRWATNWAEVVQYI